MHQGCLFGVGFVFFFFFLQRELYYFHLAQGLGEGSRVMKSCQGLQRGSLGRSSDTTGAPEKPLGFCYDLCLPLLFTKPCLTLLQPHRPQPAWAIWPWHSPGKKTGVGCHFLLPGLFSTQKLKPYLLHCRLILYHWADSLPAVFEVEPLEEVPAQPHLGASRPAEVGQVLTIFLVNFIFLMNFSCSSWGRLSRMPRRYVSTHRTWAGSAGPHGPCSGFSPWKLRLSQRPGFYPAHFGTPSACLGREWGHVAGFALFKKYSWVPHALLGQLAEKVAYTLQNHIIEVEIEAQREVGVRGCRCVLARGWARASTSVERFWRIWDLVADGQ